MNSANRDYWMQRRGRDYAAQQVSRRAAGAVSYEHQLRWLDRFIEDRGSGTPRAVSLLDVGCGFGRVARWAALHGCIDYAGFDISHAMVEPLLTSPPQAFTADINTRVRVGDNLASSFAGRRFDVILTISVFIHNDEQQARDLLSQMETLLAPDGIIILIENRLSRGTVLDNLWHSGCWLHDFVAYAEGTFDVTVDSEELGAFGHSIYMLKKSATPSTYHNVRHGVPEPVSREELLEDCANTRFTPNAAAEDVYPGLYYDAKEQLTYTQGRLRRSITTNRRLLDQRRKLKRRLSTLEELSTRMGDFERRLSHIVDHLHYIDTQIGSVRQDPTFQTVTIQLLQETNPQSQGHQAWLRYVQRKENGAKLPWVAVRAPGSRLVPAEGCMHDHALLIETPGAIEFDASGTEQLSFMGHPWSGIITITFKGRHTRLDLYRAAAEVITINLGSLST